MLWFFPSHGSGASFLINYWCAGRKDISGREEPEKRKRLAAVPFLCSFTN